MPRLPVKTTTRTAWIAACDSRALLLRLALLPFIGTLAIDLLPDLAKAMYAEAPAEAGTYQPGPLDHALIRHLLSLLKLALQTAFIAQAYRLFLLGPAAVAGDGWFRFGPETRRLFLVMLVVTLLTDLPYRMEGTLFFLPFLSLLSVLPTDLSPLIGRDEGLQFGMELLLIAVLTLGYLFAGWALAMRLAFVLPTTCLGRPLDLPARWRESRGNGWRLFAALLRLGFLVLLIGALVESVAQEYAGMATWFGATGQGEELHLAFRILERAASWICSFAIHTLWAAVTTAAFAFLTGYPAQGIRVPTPEGRLATAG